MPAIIQSSGRYDLSTECESWEGLEMREAENPGSGSES